MKLAARNICVSIVLALALCAAQRLRADVTLRYESEIKPAAALQPILGPIMDKMRNGTAGSIAIHMKGNLGYTASGPWTEIFDFTKGDVTLVDPVHKTFATLNLTQLMDKMADAIPQTPELPEAAKQILASMKSHVDSKVTGKTAEIQGVRAEERELTFTLDIPMPPDAAKQLGPEINLRIVIHIWTAAKEETLRVPAIRELAGYQTWQRYVMNPAGMFEKLAGKVPGLSTVIGPLLDEMAKNPSVMLRTDMEIYAPFLAALSKQMAAQGQNFPAIDPDAPLMEMTQRVAELSSTPVDAALFEIPKDYSTVAAEDMIREIMKAQAVKK